jgi:hypothetical protein
MSSTIQISIEAMDNASATLDAVRSAAGTEPLMRSEAP